MLTYVTITLNAPSGVTKLAGAKAYAAKLHASPVPTAKKVVSNADELLRVKPKIYLSTNVAGELASNPK